MAHVACPFCFHMIDSNRLAYQCTGNGSVECKREVDPERKQLTGSLRESFPTFLPPNGGQAATAECPHCGGIARRRACPTCHSVLPIDFVGSNSPMIGLVGAAGSGKTVLMTVLIKYLREVVGRRFSADIQIATDNPDGQSGLADYQANRELPLYTGGRLPQPTAGHSTARRSPVVVRWRQPSQRSWRTGVDSTLLSFVDTAGEDMTHLDKAFTLQYLGVASALIVLLDPFMIPGARDHARLPAEAIEGAAEAPMNVLSRVTELLRTQHNVKTRRKIKLPVAVVFPKIDAFYPVMDRSSILMRNGARGNYYDDSEGRAVHENVLALLQEWGADDIGIHMDLNYSNFRYFAVSALGAPPDYAHNTVSGGGVQPHRVEDPVLWLLSQSGTLSSRRS